MTDRRPVIYVVGFSAPPVLQLDECLELLRERDWDPYVILSPTAATWVDVDRLAKVSGHSVRVAPRMPSESDPLPNAEAVLVAPLTFNSLCKWAAGISDTLALGILNEALALSAPITAALCIKAALSKHPAFQPSCHSLLSAGIQLLNSNLLTSRNDQGMTAFRWPTVLSLMPDRS